MVERIELYRRRAGRMMRLAEACESETVKLAYLRLAAHWQDLVLDLEQGIAVDPEVIDVHDGDILSRGTD
jgi:hypothetical protein